MTTNPNRVIANYLPEQYRRTRQATVNHNYLKEQFADYDHIFEKIKRVVLDGDYTLGEEVDRLEAEFAQLCGTRHAIGVGSGTDAIFLSLRALDIKPGDEVITTPYTFYATIGAIVTSGARPIFADVCDDGNIDPKQVERAISSKTRAIVPVHWSGRACNLTDLTQISNHFEIPIISDSCHAVKATYKGRNVAQFGLANCYSFHPLKNLNVWGDGGIVTTDSDDLAQRLRLLRNHGLRNRDECEVFAYNSRLDTIQAVVARHMLPKLENITETRIRNAYFLDSKLSHVKQIRIPNRRQSCREVFHIYSVFCQNRDALQRQLVDRGFDAKIHYPVPMHLQPAADFLGHSRGDFPAAESLAATTLSLPVHEFINTEQLDQMIAVILKFYEN